MRKGSKLIIHVRSSQLFAALCSAACVYLFSKYSSLLPFLSLFLVPHVLFLALRFLPSSPPSVLWVRCKSPRNVAIVLKFIQRFVSGLCAYDAEAPRRRPCFRLISITVFPVWLTRGLVYGKVCFCSRALVFFSAFSTKDVSYLFLLRCLFMARMSSCVLLNKMCARTHAHT